MAQYRLKQYKAMDVKSIGINTDIDRAPLQEP